MKFYLLFLIFSFSLAQCAVYTAGKSMPTNNMCNCLPCVSIDNNCWKNSTYVEQCYSFNSQSICLPPTNFLE